MNTVVAGFGVVVLGRNLENKISSKDIGGGTDTGGTGAGAATELNSSEAVQIAIGMAGIKSGNASSKNGKGNNNGPIIAKSFLNTFIILSL